MLIIFIAIILLGVLAFAFVFMRGVNDSVAPERVSLSDIPSVLPQSLPAPPVSTINEFPVEMVQYKARLEEAAFKIAKFEQMLEEKNKTIATLEKEALSSEDHQGQVESLKLIMQGQIEELKKQNKQLKDDLTRAEDENVDLQTRIFAAQTAKPALPPAELLPAQQGDDKELPQADPLSLHDVFDGDAPEQKPNI